MQQVFRTLSASPAGYARKNANIGALRVYRPAPEWAEPLRLRKGSAFEKQSCLVIESIALLQVSTMENLSNALVFSFRCRSVGKTTFVAPVSGSGVGVKTHSEATAAENIVCLFFSEERYLLRSLSGSGADAETHPNAAPICTASND